MEMGLVIVSAFISSKVNMLISLLFLTWLFLSSCLRVHCKLGKINTFIILCVCMLIFATQDDMTPRVRGLGLLAAEAKFQTRLLRPGSFGIKAVPVAHSVKTGEEGLLLSRDLNPQLWSHESFVQWQSQAV